MANRRFRHTLRTGVIVAAVVACVFEFFAAVHANFVVAAGVVAFPFLVVGFRRFRRPPPEIPAFRYSTQLPHASGKATDMCLLVYVFFLLFTSFVVVVGYRAVCIPFADLFNSVHHSMHHAIH